MGEAGSGKSIEISRLREIKAAECNSITMAVDLGTFGTEERLDRELFQADEYRNWLSGAEPLRLFLDGLDEALLEQPKIIGLLQSRLSKAPVDRLRLRIACRTGAWPESLTGILTGLFPRCQHASQIETVPGEKKYDSSCVYMMELLPLRESDVRLAAGATGHDEENFLNEIRRLAVGPLAANPTTLRLLLRLYQAGQTLPTTRMAIYEQGLLTLCTPSPERKDRNAPLAVTAPRLLHLSGRLAAMTMLTARPTIFTGTPAYAETSDVTEDDLAVGSEQDEAGSFEVTPVELRLLYSETGLFTARGAERLGFAHKTYAEYLAARYLDRRMIPTAQLRSLLYANQSDVPRIIPQLHEVVGWLASMNDEVFGGLLADEPEILLLSDVTASDDETKARLAAALLLRVDRGDISYEQIRSLRPHLYRLKHPTLSTLLRPTIRDREKNVAVRCFAIDVAEATFVQDLAQDLAIIALDAGEPHRLRIDAAWAVQQLDDPETARLLIPLAGGAAGEDPDDELRGIGLGATWPRFLSVEELFAALTPPKRVSFGGIYATFLHETRIDKQLSIENLPIALSWAARLGSWGSGIRDPLGELAGRLAWRALDCLDRPAVVHALCELLIERLKHDTNQLLTPPQEDNAPPNEDEACPCAISDEKRRAVLEALVPRIAGQSGLLETLAVFGRIVSADDAAWLFERSAQSSGDESCAWAHLADRIWNPYVPWLLELWLVYEPICPAIAEAIPYPRSIALDSKLAEKMRQDHIRMKQFEREAQVRLQSRSTKLVPPPAERVRIVLDRCLQGESELFPVLLDQMRLTDTKEPRRFPNSVFDHPGWVEANEETRIQIREAGRRFVFEARIDPSNLQVGSTRFISDHAPALALDLLLDHDAATLNEIPPDRWTLIGPFLLFAPLFGSDRIALLGASAYRAAPGVMRETAMKIIHGASHGPDASNVRRVLGDSLDSPLAHDILQFLVGQECPDDVFELLAGWLMRRPIPEAREHLESLLSPDHPRSSDPTSREIRALTLLMIHAPNESWETIEQCLEDHPGLAGRSLERIARDFGGTDQGWPEKLGDARLALLLDWLVRHYPPKDDPHPTDVQWWYHGLLNLLASRGTAESCDALRQLRDSHPELPWLHELLLRGQQARLRNAWIPPGPTELLRTLQDANRRYVASALHLLEGLIESLDRYQKELLGTPPAVANLWDGSGDEPRRPKPEEHLSDNLALHLKRDLATRIVGAYREVQIRRRLSNSGAAGERIDLFVPAATADDSTTVGSSVAVTIEVKGSWNPQVASDMERQLVDRYMKDNQCRHGLYVVGWFDCPPWDDGDYRKKQRTWATIDEAAEALGKQAERLSQHLSDDACVRAVVLDCRLPV